MLRKKCVRFCFLFKLMKRTELKWLKSSYFVIWHNDLFSFLFSCHSLDGQLLVTCNFSTRHETNRWYTLKEKLWFGLWASEVEISDCEKNDVWDGVINGAKSPSIEANAIGIIILYQCCENEIYAQDVSMWTVNLITPWLPKVSKCL